MNCTSTGPRQPATFSMPFTCSRSAPRSAISVAMKRLNVSHDSGVCSVSTNCSASLPNACPAARSRRRIRRRARARSRRCAGSARGPRGSRSRRGLKCALPRSASSRRSAACSCTRTVQHAHHCRRAAHIVARRSHRPRPPFAARARLGCRRETIVTGIRCPRACRCRRPNMPMSGEGKCSIKNPSRGCKARRRAGRPCRRCRARPRTRR